MVIIRRKSKVIAIPGPPVSDLSKPSFNQYSGGFGMTPKTAPKDADKKKDSYYRHGEA